MGAAMGDEGATVKWTQNFHLRALRPKFRGHAPEILTPAAQIFGSLYMTSSVTPPSSPSPTTSACAAIVAILWGLQPSSYHPRRGAAILTILWRRRPSQVPTILAAAPPSLPSNNHHPRLPTTAGMRKVAAGRRVKGFVLIPDFLLHHECGYACMLYVMRSLSPMLVPVSTLARFW
jgi:hypothetical protein